MPRKKIKSNFENLKLELLFLIFEKLNINQLLKCRLLSKQFKKIVSQFEIKELIISNERSSNENFYFLKKTTDNKLKFKSLNQGKLIKILNTSIINFNNLNSLKVEFHVFNLEIFNKFKNLKNLDTFISEYDQNSDYELCLANLESLNLTNYTCKFSKPKLNTPKLKSLRVPFFDKINLLNPNSIVYLETFYFYKKIFELTNLEILKVDKIEYIDSTILDKLKNLKEIHFLSESYIGFSLSPTIETIRHLLNEKTLKNPNLNIYFKEHLVENLAELNIVEKTYRKFEKCGMNLMREKERAMKRNRKHNGL